MNNITINGKTFVVKGKNVCIRNGTVTVDGEFIVGDLSGEVHVHFNGDLASLNCTTATINGNIQGNVDATTVKCGNIGGDVDCTTLHSGNITGNVDATTVRLKK